MAEQVASVTDVFERRLPERLQAQPDLVSKINGIYQFNISGPGGGSWAVDCTTPGGSVTNGQSSAARCTVACSDADLLAIVNGRLNAQMAFMSGRLRIQGDMAMALKLQQVL